MEPAEMNRQRAEIEERRAADRNRDANLLNYAGDQRGRQASGTYVRPAEWTPPRSSLGDWISREVRGIDPDAGTHVPAVHVEPGQYSETDMDAFRSAAFASLDEATQAAALDPNGPGFAAAAEAFDAAIDQAAADAKAEQVRFREEMHQDSMARDPASYGR
jgi:hypothetical protein